MNPIGLKPTSTAAESDIAKSISIIKMLLKEGVPISEGTKIELSQWVSQRGDQELTELVKSSGKTPLN